MDFTFSSYAIVLSLLWFFIYWILGGVFFAVIALVRLGRVRKVRFSCLFTLWSLMIAIGAAFKGLEYSHDAIEQCVASVQTKAQSVTAVFGCGAAGIFGAFLIGMFAITLGGFLIFAISRTKTKPWIVLDKGEELNTVLDETDDDVPNTSSKFFP